MKKFLYLSAISLLLAVAGCSEPEIGPEPTPVLPLELSVYELNFDYDELRIDKTVEVKGGAEEFEMKVEYADPENAGWVDCLVEGRTIKVALTRENVDPAEQPRKATLTVTSGDEKKEVEITQASFVETDGTMTMPAGGMEFPFSGDQATLTKTITADSKVDLTAAKTVDQTGADVQVEWITSVSTEGKVVTVTVVTNDSYTPRSAFVKVTNRLDGTATFEVKQMAKPELNLVGTWNWSSLNAVEDTKEGWAAATTITGTCTIAAVDGGYVVTGIKGNGKGLADLVAANPGATITPVMYIAQNERELSVGMGATNLTVGMQTRKYDLAFSIEDKVYYGAKTLYYTHKDEVSGADTPDGSGFLRTLGYQGLDFPAVHSVSGTTETVTFAATYEDPTVKDEDDNVIPGTVGYNYFDAVITGAGRTARLVVEPLDTHRNVVLTRTIE